MEWLVKNFSSVSYPRSKSLLLFISANSKSSGPLASHFLSSMKIFYEISLGWCGGRHENGLSYEINRLMYNFVNANEKNSITKSSAL